MCYYNGQKVTHAEFIRLKNLEKNVRNYDFLNREVINGFEFGLSAVLVPAKDEQGNNDIELTQMEWGFLPDPLKWPFWETREQVNEGRRPHKDKYGRFVDGLNFLNAVSEEVLQKGKVYREAALYRRCLFLSTGFYEWRHHFPVNKRTGQPRKTAEKYPYRVGVKGQEYFWIAGIHHRWDDAETGEVVESAALLTTAANLAMDQIHNRKRRQPTMLTEDLAYSWIFDDLTEEQIQEIASYQMPWEDMEFYTLERGFTSSFDPLRPHTYTDLPALDLPGIDPSGAAQAKLF
ncbi:SOS response-associated peptidase [Niabella sp. CC-SYL272]|uniref:SOS response-associated peptidase n=1 Tax=Niabella agricola TaxID=2891571 RepID=UPI001F372BC2|nr:SOS response-associated peptidase family protein [Niabella agricola]MCF3107341.1 SOS response-associated peptidase [Niabella agricola]